MLKKVKKINLEQNFFEQFTSR